MSTDSRDAVALRPVMPEDAGLLLAWRNHPELIRLSSSQRAVTQAEHQQWFSSLIDARPPSAYVIMLANKPVGHLRFDLAAEGKALISLYLDPLYCGQGYGAQAIRQGCS